MARKLACTGVLLAARPRSSLGLGGLEAVCRRLTGGIDALLSSVPARSAQPRLFAAYDWGYGRAQQWPSGLAHVVWFRHLGFQKVHRHHVEESQSSLASVWRRRSSSTVCSYSMAWLSSMQVLRSSLALLIPHQSVPSAEHLDSLVLVSSPRTRPGDALSPISSSSYPFACALNAC